MLLQSTITCPHCATAKSETMPTDACQFFYECTGCGTKLKPKSGRLLRVLLLRLGAVSANSSSTLRRIGCYLLLCVTGDDQRTDPNLARLAWQCTHQLAGMVDA